MRNVVVIGAGMALLAAVVSGQAAVPPDGAMRELVTEIRGLRADLNRVAGANIRSQLLVGRLQLQEQRTITLSRQLDTLQQELAAVAQERLAMEDRRKQVDESTTMKVEEREEMQAAVRQQMKQLQRKEQHLRQREASLSAMVADEQARWTDVSSRLDELERSLTGLRR
jgi:septal ring factor EnvC (AmiA/AmiB activator)